jgi:uncharacterized protein YdbL (DUF1318 family)
MNEFAIMKITRVLLLSFIAAMVGISAFGAETQDTVKARIQARLGAVDQLKTTGRVGENNKGFLEQRDTLSSEQSQVMREENDDRRALYGMIAAELGYASSVIGEQRAAQIRKNSVAGIWLQAPAGNWYQK